MRALPDRSSPATTSSARVRDPNCRLPFARFRHELVAAIKTALHCDGALDIKDGGMRGARAGEPIAYIAAHASRYYAALGYPAYQWAHFADVPFAKPVPRSSPHRGSRSSRPPHRSTLLSVIKDPGAAYNAAREVLSRLSCCT